MPANSFHRIALSLILRPPPATRMPSTPIRTRSTASRSRSRSAARARNSLSTHAAVLIVVVVALAVRLVVGSSHAAAAALWVVVVVELLKKLEHPSRPKRRPTLPSLPLPPLWPKRLYRGHDLWRLAVTTDGSIYVYCIRHSALVPKVTHPPEKFGRLHFQLWHPTTLA